MSRGSRDDVGVSSPAGSASRPAARGGLFAGGYTGRPAPRRAIGLAVALGCAALALAALFVGGEYLQRLVRYLELRVPEGVVPEVSLAEPIRRMVLNTLSEVPLIPDALVTDGLPVYDLRMQPRDWQRLQATARIVTAQAIADTIVRNYVPADFWRDGEWTPVGVKLRGLYSPHYLMKRPSLRVKFPADRLFERKRQINLLDPYDKGLTADTTTNWELRAHGLMTWQSRFAVVRLNGQVLGLYQEIEQFGRSLPDRSGRPEGFILSGRGQLFGEPGPGYEKAAAAFEKMTLCHLTPRSALCNWEFLDAYFDIDRWAWAGGMMLLLQSHHGWATDNLRLFWDPAFGHFEPIPWDYQIFPADPVARPDGEVRDHSYALAFASIPQYRRLRDQRSWFLATQRSEAMIAEADRLFEELREALTHDLRHWSLSRDEDLQRRYREMLRGNARALKTLFEKQSLGIRWWPADASGRATIDVSNQGKAFVSIQQVRVQREGRGLWVELAEPLIVDGVYGDAPGRALGAIPLSTGDELVGFVARNEVTGAELRSSEIAIFPMHDRPPRVPAPLGPPSLDVTAAGVHVERDRVVIGPGRVDLARTLVVDRSRAVSLAPGLDLRMAEGVSLVVHGDFSSLGTPSEPIRISGAPGWGGVLVHGKRTRPAAVRVEHTRFEGGTGGETDRIVFSAPFSVHGGKVSLRHAQFVGSRAIDAVNLKYAEVALSNNEIRDARDDAFDCDFCTGSIERLVVRDAGGDGLDFSGSDLVLTQNVVERCGDKGISIGEATRARVREARIEDCYTGIAVKDLSHADIRGAQLSRLEVGVALYVKKPSFGPSRARVEDAELRDVATRVLRDESCSLEWIEGS